MPPATAVEDDPTCQATFVGALRGWVVDRIGRPIAGAKAQACITVHPTGMLICLFPADTDADGVFTIDIPAGNRCAESIVMRSLVPAAPRATAYCDLGVAARADEGVGLAYADPFVLYATLAPEDRPPLGDLEARRTVVFEDGVAISLRPYDFLGDYEALRARRVMPDERGLCFLDGETPPDALWAISPDGGLDPGGEPVTVTLPNVSGLPPGADVDLQIVGGLDCTIDGEHVPEGEWATFGTGAVTADGAAIESDPGVTLPCLTWIGYTAR
ncbi:MAG: hypothetical protein H6701_06215 [Myxococcales bacterium]|nr:hypothetical protein [Myxococcales bacterium]